MEQSTQSSVQPERRRYVRRPKGLQTCAYCGDPNRKIIQVGEKGYQCSSCYNEARKQANGGKPSVHHGRRGRPRTRPEGPARCAYCDRPDRKIVKMGERGFQCSTCLKREREGREGKVVLLLPKDPAHCVYCDKPDRKIIVMGEKGHQCGACYRRERRKNPERWQPCVKCGVPGPIGKKIDGGAICEKCRGKEIRDDVERHVPCIACGRNRYPVAHREGRPVCGSCYRRVRDASAFVVAPCGRCGEERFVAQADPLRCVMCVRRDRADPAPCEQCGKPRVLTSRRSDGKRLCGGCCGVLRYRDPRFLKPCTVCDRVRPIFRRLANGDPVCGKCARRDKTRWENCAGCGNLRFVSARRDDGSPVCELCRRGERPKELCIMCDEPCLPVLRFDDGPVCQRCYITKIRIERCATCDKDRPVGKRMKDGRSKCPTCVYRSSRFVSRSSTPALE